jgi:hypothetical protein
MSDPLNSPAGPARDAASIQESARQAQNLVSDLAKAAPGVKELDMLTKILGESLAKVEKLAEHTGKRINEAGSELRRVVSLSDDVEESFKAIADYQRKMMREGLKAKNWGEFSKVLQEMRKQSQNLMDKGVFSKSHTRLLNRQIKEIDGHLKGLRTRVKDAFDPEEAEAMLIQFEKMNKVTVSLAKNMKNVKLSGIGRELSGVERAVSHLFGRPSSRIDKIHQYAQTGHEIRAARKKRDEGKFREFEEHKQHIMRRLPSLGIDTKKYLRSDGSVDEDAVRAARARRKVQVQSLVASRAQERGLSPFATSLVTQSALAKSGGTGEGFMTRMGMNLLAHGEGSIGRGLASWGGSMVEGGAGGLASMAGEVAPVIGILAAVKEAFDKNQKMNAEVESGLGKGGIFGGNADSIDALRNARANLNGPGLFSRLGIGYEKNLDLAKAMVEGGFSTRNLSEGVVGHDQHGFLNNSFGSIQRNAYVYGRLAGLNPNETMTETIKLITQYRQSLGSTEDFFVQINKDTRAAGISTMKYIQLIDDVNSHYDRSNKLLMTTVTTMRMLSQTGRDTADDLKDAMDAITNGGQQQPVERAAYLNTIAMRDPHERDRILGLRQNNFQSAAEQAAAALGVQNSTQNPNAVQDFVNQMNRGGYGSFMSLKRQADERFANDPTQHQAAIGALNTAQTAYARLQQQQYANRLANSGQFAQAGLSMAAGSQNMGADIVSNSTETLNALRQALGIAHFTMGDFLNNNRRPELDSSIAFSQAKQTFGLDKQGSDKLQNLMEDAAASMLQTVTSGIQGGPNADPAVRKAKQELYEKLYQQLGASGVNLGPDKDHAAAVVNYAKSHQDEFMQKILGSNDLTDAIFGSSEFQRINNAKLTDQDHAAAMSDAEKLAASTRPTADIFADAFTYLFNKLQTPLDMIARVLTFRWGGGMKTTWATQSEGKLAEQFNNTGITDQWRAARQDEIDKLEQQVNAAPPDKKAALEAQLNQKKSEFDKLSQTAQTFDTGNGVAEGDMTDWLTDIQKYVKGAMQTAFSKPQSKQDVDNDLKMVDIQYMDKDRTQGTMTIEEERRWDGLLQTLQKMGAIKLDQVDSRSGKQYVITTTYNNLDFTQQGGGVPKTNDASERPPVPQNTGASSTKGGN